MTLPGLELARGWYHDSVEPALVGVPHSAALLGDGSEVLGFDDPVSTDHDFGARVQIFCDPGDLVRARALTRHLEVPGEAWVELTSAADFFRSQLGFDPADGVSAAQWLATPTQRLGTLTAGAVFHDPDGQLGRRRAVLDWYPDDVWRLALAAAWSRVGQHQAFAGRTGARGDELGSRLIAARLVRDYMRITFLLERVWSPYDKWFGAAFARLPLAGELEGPLGAALSADGWRDRETGLVTAGSVLLAATNRTGLAVPVDPAPAAYFTRDIRVVGADALVAALVGEIGSAQVRDLVAGLERAIGDGARMPSLPGTIDQVSDSVEVLTHPGRCAAVSRAANIPS